MVGDINVTREELYVKIWTESVSKTARFFNITDAALRKKCNEHKIPMPSNKYWARLKAGQNPAKEKLPEFEGENQIVFNASGKLASIVPAVEKKQIEDDQRKEKRLRKPHVLIEQHQTEWKLFKKTRDKWQPVSVDSRNWKHIRTSQPVIDTSSVTESSFPKMYLFLDGLFKKVEAAGGKVSVLGHHRSCFIVEGEQIGFRVKEKYVRKYTASSESVLNRDYQSLPSGKLVFIVASGECSGYKTNREKEFTETEKRTLNELQPAIVEDIFSRPAEIKEERKKREEQKHAWEEERKKAEEIKQRHDRELKATIELINQARRFEAARAIRNYAAAVETNFERSKFEQPNERLGEWIIWAKQKADWLDPVIHRNDEILDSPESEREDWKYGNKLFDSIK